MNRRSFRNSSWVGGFWIPGAIASSFLLTARPVAAVPVAITEETLERPSEGSAVDVPEEILRTEIITGARSPITGEALNAAEYAELQAELEASAGTALVNEDIRYLIFLLQLRRAVRPIIPFL